MYALLECEIHKERFKGTVGFGPITRLIPHENPRLNELDMQHHNAPPGYSVMRFSIGGCPISQEEYLQKKKRTCEMNHWKFIKEITEEENRN